MMLAPAALVGVRGLYGNRP